MTKVEQSWGIVARELNRIQDLGTGQEGTGGGGIVIDTHTTVGTNQSVQSAWYTLIGTTLFSTWLISNPRETPLNRIPSELDR
jgi:hypothetical protein